VITFVHIFVYEVYSNEIVILRYENVEDNKSVTRDHKWKENTDNAMALKKGIMILQNTTQKFKDGETRSPLQTGGELRCSGMISNSTFVYYSLILINEPIKLSKLIT
jgi:hypothetical protein